MQAKPHDLHYGNREVSERWRILKKLSPPVPYESYETYELFAHDFSCDLASNIVITHLDSKVLLHEEQRT